ncbi:hypothetical protein [Hymenobacter volaticus]|uniref:Uncharacterized protein n=1 Tax=Hymenobacter volaticus TaxID=2932254 RepID=A0ABY4GH48_9BACT|nr:hypothetical protein [Hymenobacter volaticus]UOQ69579.1 hypothetical protein MUN86_28480 [Hymenobacter volaticus]
MFNAISWSQYGLTVFLLLVAYYTYVLAVYYRHEISTLLKGRTGATNAPPAGPDTLGQGATLALRGASSLIVPSIVVAPPAPLRVEAREPQVEEVGSEDSPLEKEVDSEHPVSMGEVEQAATEVEEVGSPASEVEETSSLIPAADLCEFASKVERGAVTAENAKEVPEALENTALLQAIYTASLARRRASLAVLEDM